MVISSADKLQHLTFSALNSVNIGEVLNTPIADSETEFNFTSISGERSINITKPSQNTRSSLGHTNTRSKTSSTQFLSNIKNISKINNQQMLYEQQSLAMSPDPWGDFFDHPMMEFTAISPLSPESPMGSADSPVMPLGTTTDCENSFSWTVDGEEVAMPLSQSEETMCLANAHLHINQPYRSPSDHSYASDGRFKMHDDSCDDMDEGSPTTVENRVLYRDTMISDASKVISFLDEDTNLETVKDFNEILIKKEVEPIDDDYSRSVDVDYKPPTYSQLMKQANESVERMGCPSTDTDEFDLWKPEQKIDFIKPENKAKVTIVEAEVLELIEKKVEPKTLSVRSKLNIKKESSKMKHQRGDLPKLSLNIPPPPRVQSVLEFEQKNQLNTPDIIEETLNLEGDFDLIKYICNQQDFDVAQGIIASPVPSPKPSELPPESPVADASPPPSVPASNTCMPKRKRSSVSFYDNPGSVQSYQSSVDEPQPKKKRGRPPKTQSSLPSPSQLEGLTEQDLRYWEMRNKNNEASRRSRLHRKQKEQSMEEEATILMRQHHYLQAKEARLKRKVEWLEIKLKEAIQ
ncbi:uncharacterized protein LOC129786025 isoform X1 [Lutzomyia longipalpis]|uniref:uncharacterized protein LOC129786025 isoform X1 n=1 Tax=Lutzomyia longipalpis TaxID=7200 RepID=UPI002483A58C|nr:uncharacterized protein LOC129786025 isoform X1 [Lutzomyia longipalpis]XP_055676759.1 uncharacterized protein LOC129786025 isoform X1 [Lutzomyia longipalpis]